MQRLEQIEQPSVVKYVILAKTFVLSFPDLHRISKQTEDRKQFSLFRFYLIGISFPASTSSRLRLG